MTVDLAAAGSFLAGHARVLDRRRWQRLVGPTGPAPVLAALAAYGNDDGGYGWGLEPDLRDGSSQPVCAMHALEVLAECAPSGGPEAVTLCGWLQARARPDGGLPMALPIEDVTGCAGVWADADTQRSSLQMTAQLAAQALRVAVDHPAVRDHPWLAAATAYCLEAIGSAGASLGAHELMFSVQFLDAAAAAGIPGAEDRLDALAPSVPADGAVPVGVGDEHLRLLDLSPEPGAPSRRLFSADGVRADLDRLAGLQAPDGGWVVDFGSPSPAGTLDWRGYATVRAVTVLRAHGALPP